MDLKQIKTYYDLYKSRWLVRTYADLKYPIIKKILSIDYFLILCILFVIFSGMIIFFAAFDTLWRSLTHILFFLVYVFYGNYKVFNEIKTTKENPNGALNLLLQKTRKTSIAAIMLYFLLNFFFNL